MSSLWLLCDYLFTIAAVLVQVTGCVVVLVMGRVRSVVMTVMCGSLPTVDSSDGTGLVAAGWTVRIVG